MKTAATTTAITATPKNTGRSISVFQGKLDEELSVVDPVLKVVWLDSPETVIRKDLLSLAAPEEIVNFLIFEFNFCLPVSGVL